MPGRLAEEIVAPDEGSTIEEFLGFIKQSVDARAAQPHGARRRFNQTRAAGCVDAEFVVAADLPPFLRVGLFATPGAYRARIRFANANSASDSDADIRGMAIKVMDVPGTNLTPGATSQDFVLNSSPVMMASDTKGFLEFLRAVEEPGFETGAYFLKHPKALVVLAKARRHHTCHLDVHYWSATPYLLGDGQAVKYSAWPGAGPHSPAPGHRPSGSYLTEALIARLAQGDATFEFGVQVQADARRMPIEDAMTEWSEEESPFQRVATIRIPKQRFDAAEQWQACEAMRFDPWNALAEHRPLGGMNRARRAIYHAMADHRLGVGR
jgi:hypothetical protein